MMRAFTKYTSAVLHLGRTVNSRWTAEHDEAYHKVTQARFDALKAVISFAIHVYVHRDPSRLATAAGPIFEIQVLARRILLWTEIEATIGHLLHACSIRDAVVAEAKLSEARWSLLWAVANYLEAITYVRWPCDKLLELAKTTGELPDKHRHHFCGNPRSIRKPASLADDLAELVSQFKEGSSEREGVAVNEINVAIIQSALDALPDEFADDRQKWFRVACAIHDFDSDEIGLALFVQFSSRCPEKAEITDFEEFWSTLGGYSGKKITLGSLIHWAKEAGWKQPRGWDWAPRG
jgi:Primase C terminal 2 (PriCT-2)